MYTLDALGNSDRPKLLKLATPFPFPEKKALEFLDGLDEVLCIEELDPVIERALTYVCGKYCLQVKIHGKLTSDISASGENTVDSVKAALNKFLNKEYNDISKSTEQPPALP